jgi:hypothetical protein
MPYSMKSPMQETDVWDYLVKWWEVPQEDAHALWQALAQSQGLHATVWRGNLALVAGQETDFSDR